MCLDRGISSFQNYLSHHLYCYDGISYHIIWWDNFVNPIPYQTTPKRFWIKKTYISQKCWMLKNLFFFFKKRDSESTNHHDVDSYAISTVCIKPISFVQSLKTLHSAFSFVFTLQLLINLRMSILQRISVMYLNNGKVHPAVL